MMPIILHGALAVSVLLAVALLTKPSGPKVANAHLGIAMLVFAGWFFVAASPQGTAWRYPAFRIVGAAMVLLPPLIYFYFRAQTEKIAFGARTMFHYVPFVVFLGVWGFDVGPLSLRRLVAISAVLPNLIVNVPGVAYSISLNRDLRNHAAKAPDFFATMDRERFIWLRWLNYGIIVGLTIDTGNALSGLFFGMFADISPWWAFLILLMGFGALKQPQVFADPDGSSQFRELVKVAAEDCMAGLDGGEAAKLAELRVVMASAKPYLDPLLTLPRLARIVINSPKSICVLETPSAGTQSHPVIADARYSRQNQLGHQLHAEGVDANDSNAMTISINTVYLS